MSFRAFLVVVLLSVALLGVGCGIHLGQKDATPASITYNGGGYSCLSEIPQHIEQYFDDQLSENDISDFVGCLQKSFVSFAERTRGRDQESYEPDEIRRFLESYFIRNNKISDTLLHQFMLIKQGFVGGSSERVTRAELGLIVDLLGDVRHEAIRLKPHLKYLNLSLLQSQIDDANLGPGFQDAQKALEATIQVFFDRLQTGKQKYAFADLETFLIEFRQFVNWEDHVSDPRPAPVWVALMTAHKQIAVAGQPDAIAPTEWQPWLVSMAQWYISFLEYQVGVKNRSILRGTGLQNATLLAHQIFGLAEEAVDRQPQKVVTFAEVEKLTSAFAAIGWMPDQVKPSSLDMAVRATVTRIFGDAGNKPDDRSADGVDLLTVVNMRDEFYRWANLQKQLDESYPASLTPSSSISLTVRDFAPDLFYRKAELPVPSSAQTPWADFMQVTAIMPQPFYADGLPRIFLVPRAEVGDYGVGQGFFDLSMMNALRATAALVFRGYAKNNSVRNFWDSSITGDELQKFYVDVRELGIDLGFIDKKNFNAGSRGFVEGKLFTYASTGLQYAGPKLQGDMSFSETMAYFGTLLSGADTASELFNRLLMDCKKGPVDDSSTSTVDRACVVSRLPSLLTQVKNTPYLQAYLRLSGPEKRLNYVEALLRTINRPDGQWIAKGEFTMLIVVVYYSEAIMTRFDSSEDGILTNSELDVAFPIFTGFIKKIAAEQMGYKLSDGEARGAFYYILSTKSIPSSWSLPAIWKDEYYAPTIALDRQGLIEVFQAIIGKLMQIGVDPSTIKAAVAASQAEALRPAVIFSQAPVSVNAPPEPSILDCLGTTLQRFKTPEEQGPALPCEGFEIDNNGACRYDRPLLIH